MYKKNLNSGKKNTNKNQNKKFTKESMLVGSVKAVLCHYCMP